MDAQELRNIQEAYMEVVENQLDERTLMKSKKVRPSGTMDMRGSEGAARSSVSRAGFRKRGPIQDPKVEKSGKDVPVWVRSHNSPRDYAAHTARNQHREGDKPQSGALRRQFAKTGAKKDSPVHDITVGSPKSKVKDPGQRARQFVGALKGAKDAVKSKKGVATNTPTAIDSAKSKGKKSRSGEEGAEQRGRIYKKLGMGERDPKTGTQMAKLSDSYHKKTFGEFVLEANKFGIPDSEYIKWQRDRDAGVGPVRKTFNGVEYQMRNKARAGQPKVWAASPSSDRKASSEKRSEKEKETAVTQNQLRDAAKRDVTKSNPNERAAAAYDAEQERMSGITKRVKTTSKSSGIQQSKDHKQALQRKTNNPENQERLDRVLPGHNSDNLEIKPLPKNASKQNTALKPGESGYSLTRASVKRKQLDRGDKLLSRVGREISLTQSGKPSRAARLLGNLRKPRPKDTGAAQRMSSAYDRAVGRSFEN
jgi:hypothetical protein